MTQSYEFACEIALREIHKHTYTHKFIHKSSVLMRRHYFKQDPSWANFSQPPDSSTPRLAILSKPPVYMGHSNTMIGTLDTVISPASRPHTKQNPQNFRSSLELNLTTGDGNSKQNAESNALYDTASSQQAYVSSAYVCTYVCIIYVNICMYICM